MTNTGTEWNLHGRFTKRAGDGAALLERMGRWAVLWSYADEAPQFIEYGLDKAEALRTFRKTRAIARSNDELSYDLADCQSVSGRKRQCSGCESDTSRAHLDRPDAFATPLHERIRLPFVPGYTFACKPDDDRPSCAVVTATRDDTWEKVWDFWADGDLPSTQYHVNRKAAELRGGRTGPEMTTA